MNGRSAIATDINMRLFRHLVIIVHDDFILSIFFKWQLSCQMIRLHPRCPDRDIIDVTYAVVAYTIFLHIYYVRKMQHLYISCEKPVGYMGYNFRHKPSSYVRTAIKLSGVPFWSAFPYLVCHFDPAYSGTDNDYFALSL